MTPPDIDGPKKQLVLRVPVGLVEQVGIRQAQMHGWLMSDVVVEAIKDWCSLQESLWRRAHGGEDLPPRPEGSAGRMPRGRPWSLEGRETRRLSVMIPESLKDRFYRVAFYQDSPGDYPGIALAAALEMWIDTHDNP